MNKLQPLLLEVTGALSECAKEAHFDFGHDTAVVAVQHLLWQTVDLFQAVIELGVSPENIFALGKVYSNNAVVIEMLRRQGITVVESTTPEAGQFDQYFRQDVNWLWELVGQSLSNRNIKRIVVLDDGGVCITSAPPDMVRRYAVCGVEQTTRGMVLINETPPRFAVISWARAGVKLEIAGPIYSQYLIEKVNTEFLHGGSLQTDSVGIIGLGSIGRGVANLLVREGTQVCVYDSNPELYIPGSLRDKIVRSPSLQELMLRCDFVLGCSGRDPFKNEWPLNHRPGVKLVSASSGDQEFGPIIRDLKQQSEFKVASDTWDIFSEHGPSGPIHIAYLGYPYSFVSRGTEAAPTWIVQLDTGGLLAAMVQARLFLELCETGVEQNRGVHRLTPGAQRFVYERWTKTMQDRMIDITARFGCDPYLLSATKHEDWYIENTEPRPNEHYRPVKSIENLMDRFCGGRFIGAES